LLLSHDDTHAAAPTFRDFYANYFDLLLKMAQQRVGGSMKSQAAILFR